MIRILSLGAGVQSTAVALMMAHGEIMPCDHAIFADTQDEPEEVYEHLRWLSSPNVLPFPVHVTSAGSLAEEALRVETARDGHKYVKNMVPAFFNGGLGRRQCTREFKIRPVHRKIRELLGVTRMGADADPVTQVLGISFDERLRMRKPPEKWLRNEYPLVDKAYTRQHCLDWLSRNGYPTPPRSACYYCPFHSNAEWRHLRDNQPKEFAKAIEFERALHDVNALVWGSARQDVLEQVTLHPNGFLTEVDLDDEHRDQTDMFVNECEGMCGV